MCKNFAKQNRKSMKKVALTVIGAFALATSANAQGTWYTNRALWESLVTNVRTATYTNTASGSNPWPEEGVTATAIAYWWPFEAGTLTTNDYSPITFSFAGNSFGGYFAMTNFDGDFLAEQMGFSIDGSSTNVESIMSKTGNSSSAYTWVGYISDSSSPITVKVTPTTDNFIYVDSFSFGQGTNPANPGSNVAPEPGTLALAVTGGSALVGLFIRRRSMSN
jgi:hypothetical protein